MKVFLFEQKTRGVQTFLVPAPNLKRAKIELKNNAPYYGLNHEITWAGTKKFVLEEDK